MSDHLTGREHEGTLARDEEHARALHHLATADPERDGTLTGPAHEEKYGLERAEESAALWRGQGVHPIENRALMPGEDGWENLRGRAVDEAGFERAVEAPAEKRDPSPRVAPAAPAAPVAQAPASSGEISGSAGASGA